MPELDLRNICPEGNITFNGEVIDCGCEEQECYSRGMTCGCCGNFSYLDESVTWSDFTAGLVSCPIEGCGKTTKGQPPVALDCSSPAVSGAYSTFHEFGSRVWRGLNRNSGYYEMFDDDCEALQNCDADTILDWCGNRLSDADVERCRQWNEGL